ncbi:substrate-binding domain-containing protein [Halomonas sp. M4R1S46]|uniref:substrate-binding domain-containing protein n=1 Tax=Halomonas sp. M4R1S46 TaxID=2982692 RepID=UPI0021E3B1EE|nr:substrate-binding domain-containing protein [Halomonas sp. M4R1S46]UYG08340.1 substrate-binding domain-containing protein [Halomonas sp. M4R1S46]
MQGSPPSVTGPRRWPAWFMALVLVVGLGGAVTARAENEYIRVAEHVARHPEQRALMAQLAERVHAPAVPLATPPEAPVRIALVYPGLQTSDYWRRSLDAFASRLRRLAVPHELKAFFSRPSGDVELQARQLAEALAWEPDYLVFTLDTLPHKRIIERLLARGEPRLILQNITTPLAEWQGHLPFLHVGFDHVQGTRLIADWMLERAGHRGEYLMLYFTPGYVSRMRGGTFAAVAAQYPDVEQVAAYYTDGDSERAYRATRQTLEAHPDLAMIFACATDVALGALRALREAGREGEVLLNGWGGGTAELEALAAGGLDVTAWRLSDDNGIAMAEAIKLDLSGQARQVPDIFAGDIALVTRHTSPGEIARLERRAFRLSEPSPEAP